MPQTYTVRDIKELATILQVMTPELRKMLDDPEVRHLSIFAIGIYNKETGELHDWHVVDRPKPSPVHQPNLNQS